MAVTRRCTSAWVYEAPVRISPWLNALAILVLCVTGYLIANPLPSMQAAKRRTGSSSATSGLPISPPAWS